MDPDKVNKLATNDFVLGDGYSALGDGKVLINGAKGNPMANDVIDYVAKTGKVAVGVEGRIKTVGQ